MVDFIIGTGQKRLICIHPGPVCQFGCNKRTDTGKCCIDRFADGHRFCFNGIADLCGIHSHGIEFVLLCGRNKIRAARKHFAQGTYGGRDMLDAGDYGAVLIAKDNIGMFSHQFNDKGFVTEIPHFIQVFYLQMDDALHMGLGNAYDPPICDMFAQNHTKCRCLQGTCLVGVRQI